MEYWVGVTDNDWFHFLRGTPGLDEVNFWQPRGARRFRALAPGGLFLFKLHWPDNYVVGGGTFTHFSPYPASRAWEAFGDKNGAPSFERMIEDIEKYRPRDCPRERSVK